MRLNNHVIKFIQYFLLVFRVLAERENQVLGGHARCLRASEEESEDFIDDAFRAIFEVIIDQEESEKVSLLSSLGLVLDFFAPIVNNLHAEVT